MSKTVNLTTPLTDEIVSTLEIGDKVLISSIMYTVKGCGP